MKTEDFGLQTNSADFSEPLAMLSACHQRIRHFCKLLKDAAAVLQQQGAEQEFVDACRRIHHYFSTAGKLHHKDEEKDIFPLVIRTSLKIADLVHQLKQDHQRLDQLWDRLAPLLESPRRIPDPAQFARLADDFATANIAHVDREEQDFLPIIQHLLSSAQLEKIGRSMALRRGVRFPHPDL